MGIRQIEDIIFWEGSAGAKRVINSLERMESEGHQDVTVKWDGCVHPDTVLYTDQGEQTIQQVIERFEKNEKVQVLVKNLQTQQDYMVPINMAGSKDGHKSWITIHLENGSKITLTEDHEVHTSNRGWVQAKDLTSDDDITEIAKK